MSDYSVWLEIGWCLAVTVNKTANFKWTYRDQLCNVRIKRHNIDVKYGKYLLFTGVSFCCGRWVHAHLLIHLPRGSIQIAFAATYPGSYLLCYFHSVCEHFLCLYQCFQIFLFYCNHYTTHPPDQVNHCLMVQLFMRAHDVRTLRILLKEKRQFEINR